MPDEGVEPVVPLPVVLGQRLDDQEVGDRLVPHPVAEALLEALAEAGQVGVAVRDLAGVLNTVNEES